MFRSIKIKIKADGMWVWDTDKNDLQVIKQSHVILNFLGMEGKLTNSHIEAIWQSAQLKHCSKQVHRFFANRQCMVLTAFV
jgi:light-regulated signal transduction histidine kinase (bacteriophytochrome)